MQNKKPFEIILYVERVTSLQSWVAKISCHCQTLINECSISGYPSILGMTEHYGIRGVELSRFSSYPSKRNQFISVNDSTSNHLEVSCGVSRGSVLGLGLALCCFLSTSMICQVCLRFYFFMSLLMILISFIVQVT